jgi:hypothetical protein
MPCSTAAAGRSVSALVGLVLSAVLLSAVPAASEVSGAPRAPGAASGDAAPTVLVGVPGLLWEDVTPETTPTLWDMAERTAIGNVSIRTATSRTCPTDGWLTVSAGQRALSDRESFTVCEAEPAPVRDGSGVVLEDYGVYADPNRESVFQASVGLLGQSVREAGGTTLAVGPGAALGVADTSGRVDHYLDSVHDLTPQRLSGVTLAAVELPELTRLYPEPPLPDDEEGPRADEPDPEDVPSWAREEALAALDGRLRSLVDVLPTGSSLMVVGVSMDTGPSQLTVAASGEVAESGVTGTPAFLASDSTRRPGLVALTDTTPTLLERTGVPAAEPVGGRAWHQTDRPSTTEAAVVRLVDFNTAAVVVGGAIPGFFSGLVAFQLLIYAAAAYSLHRYAKGRHDKRALVLTVTRVVALAGASFPVASYLANLVPWWASSHPSLALLACVLSADALVVALAVAGPWRRTILGPMTVVAATTTVVLFVDLCFGADLQMNSPTGYSPIVAGRFYGIGNIAFATFATGMLMAVAGLSHELISRGRRRAAVVSTSVIGVASVAIVGWPGLGTDFGGVIALVPGLAVTTMMIAGIRVTPLRLGAAGLAAVSVIALLSWLDYLRPPQERSHFGEFTAQVLGGEAAAVITRKLSAMLGTLGNWQLTLLAAGALLFLFAVLNRPTNWRIGALQRAYEDAPTLRAGLTGSLVTALVGFAANDSGVAIPAIALTVAVPLTLSACAWALQEGTENPPNDHRTPESAHGM